MQASTNRPIWDADDCALVLIDYQNEMFSNVRSIDPEIIELNVRTLVRGAKVFNIPIILSTVGVKMEVNEPTVKSIRQEMLDVHEIDRSSMNAWEDANFVKAVKATGRRRLVFGALWTEICLAFPVLESMKSGFEACFVADAVGGQSKIEHDTAVVRMIQAGAIPNTTCAMVAEWFRDWKSERANVGREVLVTYWQERAKLGRKLKEQER